MKFSIKEINSPYDIKKFIKFPHKLYKKCDQYVPVLDSDEYKILTQSPSLEYCKIKMWLALSDTNDVVGRVAAIYNPRSNEYHNQKRVRFGWLDFIDDYDVLKSLIDKVEDWSKELGMSEIHGPLGYNTWNRQGMLIEGFENTPPINCLYNYSYYPQLMDRVGFEKQVDWVQVKIKANVGVPDKIKRINQLLLEKYKLRVIDLKEFKDPKKRETFIDNFFKNYNFAFKDIDNFVPLTKKEIDTIANEYFPKLKEELTCIIADENDNIAAFGICFPNLSTSFKKAKGKLFPFGLFHILREFKRYDTIDLMILGSSEEWQNKGISSIYHTHLATNLSKSNIQYAISNPQAENNSAYKVWSRYGFEPYMRRRCYIKSII